MKDEQLSFHLYLREHDSGAGIPQIRFQLRHFLTLWFWESLLTLSGLQFLQLKMGVITALTGSL